MSVRKRHWVTRKGKLQSAWVADYYDGRKRIRRQSQFATRQDAMKWLAEVQSGAAPFLIWSEEHHAWWKDRGRGYSESIFDAGRYTETEAIEIIDDANRYRAFDEPIKEVAVRDIWLGKNR